MTRAAILVPGYRGTAEQREAVVAVARWLDTVLR